VVVDSILLALEIPEPKEVWPTIPAAQGGNPNNRNIKDNIVVTLIKNLKPYPEQNVTTTVRMILPSGGHDHTNQPPQNLLGQLCNMRTNDVSIGKITTQTFTDGTILLSDKTSEIGGEFEFTATATIGSKKLEAKDTLTVRVPGLVALGTSQNYEVVGAPGNYSGTNDPCRPYPPASQHNNNHYGTQSLITAVQNIANSYSSVHPGIRLRINDMSLEYGGLFDCGSKTVQPNTWQAPHNSHRIGKNADIGFTGIDINGGCVSINRRELREFIRRYTQNQPLIEADHYHIFSN
jgi:hypothetical protein